MSEDQWIRTALKFLSRANRHAAEAMIPLEELFGGEEPSSIRDLLQWYRFRVEGFVYRGRLTREQHVYLADHQGCLKDFFEAVTQVLFTLDEALRTAAGSLWVGLDGPKSRVARVNGPVPGGCCRYDTAPPRDGVSQVFCEQGLGGTWTPGNCDREEDKKAV
jgi:hypothetical protein